MPRHRFVIRSGQPIRSLQDWLQLAPPQEDYQWAEGRSAMELARRWLDAAPDFPREVAELLTTRDELAGTRPFEGIAEAETAPDDFPGFGRHHDLLVICDREPPSDRPVAVLGVEGKVDESFDQPVNDVEAAALRRTAKTKVPERIRLLAAALFGGFDPARHGGLRYQLLHATVGAIIEAQWRHAKHAALVIHEFTGGEADAERQRRNTRDLEDFLHQLILSGTLPPTIVPGVLYGPFTARGTRHVSDGFPFFVGKAQAPLG